MRHLLFGVKHIVQDNTAASHVDVDRKRLRFGLGLHNDLVFSSIRGFVGPGKFSHQCIATVIIEVYSCDICVIEGACAAGLVAVSSPGSIKRRSLATAAAGSREGGALEIVLS